MRFRRDVRAKGGGQWIIRFSSDDVREFVGRSNVPLRGIYGFSCHQTMTSDSFSRLGSEWGLQGTTLLCPAQTAQAKSRSHSKLIVLDKKDSSRFIESVVSARADTRRERSLARL